MKEKNTYIFDLDGTLLNTLDDLAASTNAALQTMGYPPRTTDEIRRFIGNGIRMLIIRALPGGADNPDFDAVFHAFQGHYKEHCNDRTCAYPGVMDMLAELKRRGCRMAIVSNKADAAVKELNALYFKDYIDVAIGEMESRGVRKKPAPDTVFRALELLGSTAEEAYYVGDSEVDVLTAANAGMDGIFCSWGFRSVHTLRDQGAEVIIDTPDQLLVHH